MGRQKKDDPDLREAQAFKGAQHAKQKRLQLAHFRHVVETMQGAGMWVDIIEWVKKQESIGVRMAACVFCKTMRPHFYQYCLSCKVDEKGVVMVEKKQGEPDPVEEAVSQGKPLVYIGRVSTEGACDLHETMDSLAHVQRICLKGGKYLTLCGQCARYWLEKSLTDYWLESRNLQEIGRTRTFWGKTPLFKTETVNTTVVRKEVA